MDPHILILVFLAGCATGLIGNLTGGAALFNIPAMIVLGVPPHFAIAANRFGALGMEISALIRYLKTDYIYWPWVLPMSVMAIIGGLVGSATLLHVDADILQDLVAMILLLLLPVFWYGGDIGVTDRIAARAGLPRILAFALLFLLFVYGGFLGAGAGPLIILVLSTLAGMTILQVKATTKIPWFLMSAIAFAMFLNNDIVSWPVCFATFAGMATGGYAGVNLAIKAGNTNLRLLISSFALILSIWILLR